MANKKTKTTTPKATTEEPVIANESTQPIEEVIENVEQPIEEEKWVFLTQPIDEIVSKGGNIWTVIIGGKTVRVNKQMLKRVN